MFYIIIVVGVTVTVTVTCPGHVEADEPIIGILEFMDPAAVEDVEDVLWKFVIVEEPDVKEAKVELEGTALIVENDECVDVLDTAVGEVWDAETDWLLLGNPAMLSTVLVEIDAGDDEDPAADESDVVTVYEEIAEDDIGIVPQDVDWVALNSKTKQVWIIVVVAVTEGVDIVVAAVMVVPVAMAVVTVNVEE